MTAPVFKWRSDIIFASEIQPTLVLMVSRIVRKVKTHFSTVSDMASIRLT